MNPTPKTAVLLFGFLRTAEVTSKSLLDNVASTTDADIFYFGPDASDNPSSIHKGILDGSGFMKVNPKNDAHEIAGGISERLNELYGSRLKSYSLHSRTFDDFCQEAAFINKNDWLFSLNPARFISMFFNMQGVFKIMEDYESANSFKYDRVVVTRPDLSFYSNFDLRKIREGYVYIPSGSGFCEHTGNRNYGLAQVLPYRNKNTGKMVQSGIGFNDQLLIFNRESSSAMSSIYDCSLKYMQERVPLTPETILYYHLVVNHGLKVKYSDDWPYEIVRSDETQITTVSDLVILDLIDKYHPNVKARMKEKPIKYFFKFMRISILSFIAKYCR